VRKKVLEWHKEPPIVFNRPHKVEELERVGLIEFHDVYDGWKSKRAIINFRKKYKYEFRNDDTYRIVLQALAQITSLNVLLAHNIFKPYIIINSVSLDKPETSQSVSAIILDHIVVGYKNVFAIISKNYRKEVSNELPSDEEMYKQARIVKAAVLHRLSSCLDDPPQVQVIVSQCCSEDAYYNGRFDAQDPDIVIRRAQGIDTFIKAGGYKEKRVFNLGAKYKRPSIDQQGIVTCLIGQDLPEGWIDDPVPKRFE